MKLVYKKDGFINKFFTCLLLSIFLIMFLIGSSVFAADIFDSDNNTYTVPELLDDYYYFCIKVSSSNGSTTWLCGVSDTPVTVSSFSQNSSKYIISFFATNNGRIRFFNTYSNPQYFFDLINSLGNIGPQCNFEVESSSTPTITSFLTNYNILSNEDNNTVVFQAPPQQVEGDKVLAPIVEGKEMKPLEEILTLLPIVMIVVVSYLALRKALATLFNFLRTS